MSLPYAIHVLWRWRRHKFPKCRHFIFTRRGTTKKKIILDILFFWFVTSCSLVCGYNIVEEHNVSIYCEDGSSLSVRNLGRYRRVATCRHTGIPRPLSMSLNLHPSLWLGWRQLKLQNGHQHHASLRIKAHYVFGNECIKTSNQFVPRSKHTAFTLQNRLQWGTLQRMNATTDNFYRYKSGCYNESGGILSAEVALAYEWRVGPFLLWLERQSSSLLSFVRFSYQFSSVICLFVQGIKVRLINFILFCNIFLILYYIFRV
jgi:hypothetical protein